MLTVFSPAPFHGDHTGFPGKTHVDLVGGGGVRAAPSSNSGGLGGTCRRYGLIPAVAQSFLAGAPKEHGDGVKIH